MHLFCVCLSIHQVIKCVRLSHCVFLNVRCVCMCAFGCLSVCVCVCVSENMCLHACVFVRMSACAIACMHVCVLQLRSRRTL